MSRNGATPRGAPIGWVYLESGYTIRWRRGDPAAHVLRGKQMDDYGMAGVLESIPVSPPGWTDLAEIRQLGQRWRSQRRNQQNA
ncbi:MAG: hypothetical protein ACRDRI_09920 [Pseudonocardiaceae bacterium]